MKAKFPGLLVLLCWLMTDAFAQKKFERPTDGDQYLQYEGTSDCNSAEELLQAGQKRIIVVLSEQKVYAYDGSRLFGKFDTVTGKRGKATSKGRHFVLEKQVYRVSIRYKSPMWFSLVFTEDVQALHEGNISMRRQKLNEMVTRETDDGIEIVKDSKLGSRGCVRLDPEAARRLFEWTPLCTPVDVVTSFNKKRS